MIVYDQHPHRRLVWKHLDCYCGHGLEGQLLPLIPGGKQPVRGVRWSGGLPSVMADYGRAKMTDKRLSEYYFAEPLCNLGLLTGIRSGIVVIDIDRPKSGDPQALRRFEKVMAQVKRGELLPGIGASDTTYYLTTRGAHLLYKRPCALKSVSGVMLSELGLAVDVKGEGGMVVVPPSQTGNRRREFLRGLDWLKPVLKDAEIVRMTLGEEGLSSPVTGLTTARPLPKFYVNGYLCIKALAESDIPEGRRDINLLILYNQLLRAGNVPEHSQKVVRQVNASLSKPMTEAELKKCFGRFNYGCVRIRQELPEIESVCARCRRAREAEKALSLLHPLVIEKMVRSHRLAANAAACFLITSGQALSVREAADALDVEPTGVYAYIRELRAAGIDCTKDGELKLHTEPRVHTEANVYPVD